MSDHGRRGFSLSNYLEVKIMSYNRNYESEDDDGDDPCPYCGHDPCCCKDDEDD